MRVGWGILVTDLQGCTMQSPLRGDSLQPVETEGVLGLSQPVARMHAGGPPTPEHPGLPPPQG